MKSLKVHKKFDISYYVAEKDDELQRLPSLSHTGNITNEEVGLPLRVFGRGNLCHPYLSLSYIDTLSQPCVRGYMIGATNMLFKQKKGVAEVIVDIEKDKIDILDPELKRALQLTTEDLRFTDYLVKQACLENGSDIFLDGVGWEGGDEWVRAQFRLYLLCLLRTNLNSTNEEDTANNSELNKFNMSFVQLWKRTMNYKLWREHVSNESLDIETFVDLPGLHPCSGQLSIGDVKLHISNTITNTEGGKKVAQAVVNVAGHISSAKGVFSSFFRSKPDHANTTEANPGLEPTVSKDKYEENQEEVNTKETPTVVES